MKTGLSFLVSFFLNNLISLKLSNFFSVNKIYNPFLIVNNWWELMAIKKSENLKFSKKVLEKGSQSTQGEKTLQCYEGKMADNTRMQGLIYVLYYISQYPSNVIHTRNFQKLIFS